MKNFKNDKERLDFIDNYSDMENGWYVWKHDDDMQRTVWRNDLDEDLSFIVEEDLQTFSWPAVHRKWTIRNAYIAIWSLMGPEGDTFADRRASRTMMLTALKEFQKRRKS